jgi:hypothetical protein
MLASFGRSQTLDRAGAETLVREACSTMEIGSDCSEFQASLMDTPDVKWDVVGRRGDAWPVHGAVTPTGKLYAVWSEWPIEKHRARPRTGRNAWRDEADVREFVLPFVRKYATAEEWDESGSIAFEPSVPGEKGKRGRVLVRFLRTTGGYPWLDRAVAATFDLDYESRSVLSASFPHDVVLAPTFHNEVLVTKAEALRGSPEGSKARLGWYTVPHGSTTATARLVWTVRHPRSHMFVYDATTGERVDVSPVATGHPLPGSRATPASEPKVVRRAKEPQPVRSLEAASRPGPKAGPKPPPAWPTALAAAAAVGLGAWLWRSRVARARAAGRPG